MFVVTRDNQNHAQETHTHPKLKLNEDNCVSTLIYYGETKPGEIPVFHCALDYQLSADGDRVVACNYPSGARVPAYQTARVG